MYKHHCILAMLIILQWGISLTPAFAQENVFFYSNNRQIPLMQVPDEITIQFADQVSEAQMATIKAQSAELLEQDKGWVSEKKKTQSFTIRSNVTVAQVAQTLRQHPAVRSVNPVLKSAPEADPMYLTDEFLVKFRDGITRAQIDQYNQQNFVEIVRTKSTENGFVLRVTAQSGVNSWQMANRYYESGLGDWSLPNFLLRVEFNDTPNDPFFNNQYQFHNTGQTGGSNDADIDAVEAWDITKGSSDIIVAVID